MKKAVVLGLIFILLSLLVLSIGEKFNLESANADTSPLFSREYGFTTVDGMHATYNEFTQEEMVADYISNEFSGTGYDDQNNWNTQTTSTQVTSDIASTESPYVTYATNFWLGDCSGQPYTFPPPMYADHQGFSTYDSSTLRDYNIWWAMNPDSSKYYFNFIWTCENGGCYYDNSGNVAGIQGLTGQSDGYGDNPPNTYPYDSWNYYYEPSCIGMTYAWTGRTDLNTDGFYCRVDQSPIPPADQYCYIGFQDHSPGMLDSCPQLNIIRGPMATFIEKFYDYALGYVDGVNHPIWECLEYASLYTFDNYYEYSNFYHYYYDSQGWWWKDTVDNGVAYGWWYNYLNVFGNSDLTLPYITHSPPPPPPQEYAVTINAVDQYSTSVFPAGVYFDGAWSGWAGNTYYVIQGTHSIAIDNLVYNPGYDCDWMFNYFDTGTGYNPITLNVGNDMTVTAYYVWPM